MSVFTPKRIERGESWQPLPVHSDQDDSSVPSGSAKSPSPDPLSVKSLGDELNSEPDGNVLSVRRHSEAGMSPWLSRAASLDPKLNILDMSADEIAEQLTLIDLALLKNINLFEFERCKWTKKEKGTLAPNIIRFLQRFNHTSFWLVRDVLNEAVAKNRAELIMQFIKITRRLQDLNNLHSLVAMVGALDSIPIQRLSNTWKHVSRRDRSTFEKLSELISGSDNYAQLRARMSPLQLPCIPHLGLYLRDLVYLDSLPSIGGDVQQKIGDILSKIAACQQSHYVKLSALPVVQKYLVSVRYIEELQKFYEDDNYKLSLKREPGPLSSSQATNTPRAVSNTVHILPPRLSKSQESLLTPLKPVSAEPMHLVTKSHKAPAETKHSTGSDVSNDIPILQVIPAGGSRSASPQRKGSTLPSTSRPDLKGTASCTAVSDKPPSHSPKPFKKKKGHYKSMSLGSNVLTVLGVNSKPEGRVATPEISGMPVSLLDDSFLDNCITKSSTASEHHSPYTPPLSTTSSAEVYTDEESEVFLTGEDGEDEDDISCNEAEHVLKEGKLKRKVLRRRGSSVTFKFAVKNRLQTIQLTPLALLYPSSRHKYSKHSGKVMKGISLEGVKIHYCESSFQLKDKQFIVEDKNGTQLKFTASTASEAESWAESIRKAGEQLARKQAEEKPLIKL